MIFSPVWDIVLKDGIKIPILGLGTYKAQGDEIKNVIEQAIDIGYRHFDTADFYGNLVPVGEGFKKAIENGKVKREDLFVVTKVWITWYGPGRVRASVEKMLKESGLNYFDLVLLHWPTPLADSDIEWIPLHPDTGNIMFSTQDIVDVYLELESVQRSGLTRTIGVSNFNRKQLERLINSTTIIPVTNQVECHLYLAQFEMQKLCAQHGIMLTAYSPLSRNRPNDSSVLDDKVVKFVATKYGKTTAQVAIRWLIQRGIIAIPKTVNLEHLKENFNVFDFEISEQDCKALDSLDRGEDGRRVLFNNNGLDQHPEYPFKE